MKVLIVQSVPQLGGIWKAHLGRCGMVVDVVHSQERAIGALSRAAPDVIILDLVVKNGSALAIADYAQYRCPGARVIFVTNTSFFSDGSIFSHAANACAFVQTTTPPEDLAAMVEHYAEH